MFIKSGYRSRLLEWLPEVPMVTSTSCGVWLILITIIKMTADTHVFTRLKHVNIYLISSPQAAHNIL